MDPSFPLPYSQHLTVLTGDSPPSRPMVWPTCPFALWIGSNKGFGQVARELFAQLLPMFRTSANFLDSASWVFQNIRGLPCSLRPWLRWRAEYWLWQKALAKDCPEINGAKKFLASPPCWKTPQRTSLLKGTLFSVFAVHVTESPDFFLLSSLVFVVVIVVF